MPFLCPSSSSSTIMGKKTSCSSKRNRQLGSCSSTLVSSPRRLLGPVMRRLGRATAACGSGVGSRRRLGGVFGVTFCVTNGAARFGAVVATSGAASRTWGVIVSGTSGDFVGGDLGRLTLALGRAGTLKSCKDSRAARLDGAVGKGMGG